MNININCGRIKSTETTLSCRIDAGQKNAFLNTLARYDIGSNEPYKYRPGTVIRSFVRAYTAEPELLERIIDKYR